MPKDGQHNNDAHDYDKAKGPNNPEKSVDITTGTPKNKETYSEQAANRENPARQAQGANREWDADTRDKPTIENSPRARDSDIGSGKSGSESNQDAGTRGH
jgi:hypothetical protein